MSIDSARASISTNSTRALRSSQNIKDSMNRNVSLAAVGHVTSFLLRSPSRFVSLVTWLSANTRCIRYGNTCFRVSNGSTEESSCWDRSRATPSAGISPWSGWRFTTLLRADTPVGQTTGVVVVSYHQSARYADQQLQGAFSPKISPQGDGTRDPTLSARRDIVGGFREH